ncbi:MULTISPECIES: hypothetical protein [Providencia]|uniref:hypothetical protein n=1 Tax=Providencia TaxID=586 RepID=UPI000C7EDCCD|nr:MULTISPECIES: hypothetical protein [Providencia]AXH61702.1 hypothetical protein CYG50_06510 [Providencia huaxiensis]EJD6376533.1 hypothetical protein [Providencia rettgeri]ELR5117768.1 hypothetical protein [Providencia rettgeri]MCG5280398.1 hypothetical protein [Providencia rettgeri]MCX9110617.1 hypothetical protein [Providencia rettgeri]
MNGYGRFVISLIVAGLLVLTLHFSFAEETLKEHTVIFSGLLGGLCSVLTGFVANIYYSKNKVKRFRRYKAVIYRKQQYKRSASEKKAESLAVLFLLSEQKKAFYSYLILVLPLPILFIFCTYSNIPLYFLTFPLILSCFIAAKNTLLKFRIEHGYFGYNNYEAMQLLKFIQKRNINISGGSGRILRDPHRLQENKIQAGGAKEGAM